MYFFLNFAKTFRVNKKTLILGASLNPYRFSYQAAQMLSEHGIPAAGIGKHKGELFGIPIQNNMDRIEDIHTVTIYLSPENQNQYFEYLLGLNPKRIIFNPGTENPVLENLALAAGIEVLCHCTLVMLMNGEF